jgi:hypothetical protein
MAEKKEMFLDDITIGSVNNGFLVTMQMEEKDNEESWRTEKFVFTQYSGVIDFLKDGFEWK